MGLNKGAIKFGRMQAAAAVAIFLSTLLAEYALALTGLIANDLFTFKFQIVATKLLSANFVFFLLAFPLPFAIMATFARKMEKTNLILVSMLSTVLALIAAMAAFPSLQSLWIPMVFCVVSVPLAIETAFVKYRELKSWVTMRTMLSVSSRTITLVSIGLIALSLATILPQQQQYLDRFEGFIEDFAQGFTSERQQQNVMAEATDRAIEAQVEFVDTILESPSYKKLKEKQDPDVMAFVMQSEEVKSYLQSDQYKQQVDKQLSETTKSMISKMDIVKTIKQQFPLFETMEQMIWALHGLTIIAIFSITTNIVSKPAAVVYGLIAGKALALFDKQPAKQEKINN